jgi:erythromycin esterase
MLTRSIAAALCLVAARAIAPEPDAAFVAWARERAVSIDAAGTGFRTLDRDLAGARVIGMGESVHEVDTFLTFRLQLTQDLVRRHRVTALVLESGLPEAMEADDYVRGLSATIDFDRALPGGYGNPIAIRRTIEWLREWNLGPGRSNPVGVYGADFPARSGSMVPALDRLQELLPDDPEIRKRIDSVRSVAALAASGWWKGATDKYTALSADQKAGLTSDVGLLLERVDRLSEADRTRREWARRIARVIQQNETMLRLGAFAPTAPRDQALTENTLWFLGRLASGDRAVFWAHNAHVQRAPVEGSALPPGRFPSAGMRLGEALGKGYYAIATAYGGPSMDNATPAAAGSVDAVLEAVAPRPFLLSLHGKPGSPEVVAWLAQPRPMRFQTGYLTVPLGLAFDAVAYFDGAARALRAPENKPTPAS